MRKTIYIFGSLIGALAIALLTAVVLLRTETGSRWLFYRAVNYIPGQLNIDRMRGNLVSGLSLYGVNYRLDQLNAQIQRVELNWQPMVLFAA